MLIRIQARNSVMLQLEHTVMQHQISLLVLLHQQLLMQKLVRIYTTYRIRNIAANSIAMTAGSSSLANGNMYLQYE